MLNDGPQNGQHSAHDSLQGGHGSDFFWWNCVTEPFCFGVSRERPMGEGWPTDQIEQPTHIEYVNTEFVHIL